MKYLVSIGLILTTAVTFVYYLLNSPNFLPINELSEYNWINILTLILLVSLILFSLLNLSIYSALSLFKKREIDLKEKIVMSFKFSLIFTTAFLTIFILNFFHILNWIWGLSIFAVVLIFIFII